MYGLLFTSLAITVLLLLTIIKWTIQYFLDPKSLRRYPNMSLLSGITTLPYCLISYNQFRSKHLHDLHKSTGHPVIRTGPTSLSFSDPRAIKDIYGHNSQCLKDGNYAVQAGSHFHLADVVDKKHHARKRKVLSSAYALKNLEDWEFKVADKVERLMRQFDLRICDVEGERGDVVVDYRPWTNYFTLDAIADIGLTHRLNFLDNASDLTIGMHTDGTTYSCHLRECLYANSRVTSIFAYSYDYYKLFAKYTRAIPYFGKLWKLNDDWDGIPRYLAKERWERFTRGEKLDDFFQALMEGRGGEVHGLEWGEILAEITIMMNAGSTTTAISMSNVMYQLLKYPTCMTKLLVELNQVLDPTEEDPVAPYEKVKHLPYLRACLDESLRLYPPIAQGLTREIPPQGQVIAGEYLLGGTTVSISAYTAHRDPNVFPDPEEFRPERWLGEEGKELGPFYIAFSAGARGCIGRNIAYLEQTVLLASLLNRYEFEFWREEFEIERFEWQNLHLKELPVRIWRRGDRRAGGGVL